VLILKELKARCFVIDSQVLIQRQLRWPVKALVYERLLFVGEKKAAEKWPRKFEMQI
jgi:hypothetical protein